MPKQCAIIAEANRGGVGSPLYPFLDLLKEISYPNIVQLKYEETTLENVFEEVDKAVSMGCTQLLYYKNWGHGTEWTEDYYGGEIYIPRIAYKLIELNNLEQVIWFTSGCYSYRRVPQIEWNIRVRLGSEVNNAFITGSWSIKVGAKETSGYSVALRKFNYDMVKSAKWLTENYPIPGDIVNPYVGWMNLTGREIVSIKEALPPPTPPVTPPGKKVVFTSVPSDATVTVKKGGGGGRPYNVLY